jgi:hypothetical protein
MLESQITIAMPQGAGHGPGALEYDPVFSTSSTRRLLEDWKTEYLLLQLPGPQLVPGERSHQRLHQIAVDSGAGVLYSDFREESAGVIADHPLIDYQVGSIRDNFDFGSLMLFSRAAVDRALTAWGGIADGLEWGGLYDLRLKLSIDSQILRVPEPLYTRSIVDERASGEKIFDYVDPRRRAYQIEMETIATAHLKRIGAYLEPEFSPIKSSSGSGPKERGRARASIVIPVRNRVKTIQDAVRSALSQKTDFEFNVLVVDNHSSDGTTEVLAAMAAEDARLVHLIPQRTDLGIGGCWNQAIYSDHCGEYAVQLDSDDLYQGEDTLARVVAEFAKGPYAMVIGSYSVVDFDLKEIPPGVIDHREWTRENGRNNALRINGLGAPRAFDVSMLRKIGLPNTSYGEDYAVALRISRQYEIGRIYDSLYFARRWSGNSDSALPIAQMNRYDVYKDRLRSLEIQARQRLNQRRQGR